MRHIGVMGGAFNPIHTRHLMVAQSALDQFQLEKVIFVPSGTPPHKKAGLLDKETRFEMVAAAVAENPHFEASRLEVDRPGITWTIDTLRELQARFGPDVRLNFIIGEDNLASLRDYDRRAEFLSLCRLLVSPRQSADPDSISAWKAILPEADMHAIDSAANTVSSTLVRDWAARGRSLRYLVPPPVARIIEERGLYRPAPAPAPKADTGDCQAGGAQPPSPAPGAEGRPGKSAQMQAGRQAFVRGLAKGGAQGMVVGSALCLGFALAHPGVLPAYFVALLAASLLVSAYIFIQTFRW